MKKKKLRHPLAPTTPKEWFCTVGIILGAFALAYLIVADIVFKVRHPWATDLEILLHMKDALTFKTVPYEVMRPR